MLWIVQLTIVICLSGVRSLQGCWNPDLEGRNPTRSSDLSGGKQFPLILMKAIFPAWEDIKTWVDYDPRGLGSDGFRKIFYIKCRNI